MEKEKYHFLLFELNKYKFAFDVAKINRIARSVEVTSLPNAPDIVLGVINVQGTIMPVIDIRKIFGFPERKVNVDDFLIIGKVKELSIALIIDDVLEIIDIPSDKIIDKKNVLPGIPHVDGILKLEGDIIYINDLNKLLSLDEKEEIYTLLKKLDVKKESQKTKKTPSRKKSTKKKTGTKKQKKKSKKSKKSTKKK
ncbi:MAG: chemotaxis protein CheW [bacterium]